MAFAAEQLEPFSEKAIAKYAGFSIDDYGKADEGPYQIVMPTYQAPVWLKRYASLVPALRECGTLCKLKGLPFRTVRWGREGSGAKGGIPCEACGDTTPNPSHFPRHVGQMGGCRSCRKKPRGLGYLPGFPDAHPIAEFRPNGQQLVFNKAGVPQLVGKPDYAVSHNPFPRTYKAEVYPQRYLEAVYTAQKLAQESGRRAFVCSGFGGDRKISTGTPVVYADPGGNISFPSDVAGTVGVNPVSPEYFQELVAESRGRSFLGQGA